jgi:hypothetical protein
MLPTDFLVSGERNRPGVFDTDRAREAGAFETWKATGPVDGDFAKMRLSDIDREIMADAREGLLVNSPHHRPERKRSFVPSRNPVASVTPATSASWDGPRDPQGVDFRIELDR